MIEKQIRHCLGRIVPAVGAREQRLRGLRQKHQPALLTGDLPFCAVGFLVSISAVQEDHQGIKAGGRPIGQKSQIIPLDTCPRFFIVLVRLRHQTLEFGQVSNCVKISIVEDIAPPPQT